tara:strand:- start:386 stop:658 length:273 start_codon:yes stop_codon:yes gene_type:complete
MKTSKNIINQYKIINNVLKLPNEIIIKILGYNLDLILLNNNNFEIKQELKNNTQWLIMTENIFDFNFEFSFAERIPALTDDNGNEYDNLL